MWSFRPAAGASRSRLSVRRLFPVVAGLAFAVFAASALGSSVGSVVRTSTLNSADPVVTNPPTGSSPSSCAMATPSPSARSGSFHYEMYTFRNISHAPQCVTVSLAVSRSFATATAYLGAFNPNSPNANLLGGFGQPGYIYSPGQADGFSFNISCFFCQPAAPDTFVVVVSEGFANAEADYTLLVEGLGVVMTGGGPTAADGLQSFRAAPGQKGVRVSWHTRSEQGALGFNVYRGVTKKVRLTTRIVPASGDGRAHAYSYLDRSAHNGKGAYYLEIVQRSGSRVMFGPARSAKH